MPTDPYHEKFGWTEKEERQNRIEGVLFLVGLIVCSVIFTIICYSI